MRHSDTLYTVILGGRKFCRKQDFHGLFFADHQVEYIVSLSTIFSRMNIPQLTNVQQNPQNLRPSKITVYTVNYTYCIILYSFFSQT